MATKAKTATKAPAKTPGKDVQAFRELHDKSYIIPKKIKDGLAALGDSWEYEADFMRRCGLSHTDFAAHRDDFMEFYVTVGGQKSKRVWAGTKSFAAKLRELA